MMSGFLSPWEPLFMNLNIPNHFKHSEKRPGQMFKYHFGKWTLGIIVWFCWKGWVPNNPDGQCLEMLERARHKNETYVDGSKTIGVHDRLQNNSGETKWWTLNKIFEILKYV